MAMSSSNSIRSTQSTQLNLIQNSPVNISSPSLSSPSSSSNLKPSTTNHTDSTSSNENVKEKNLNLITFISGGIAGSIAKTLVAPIDRCKILRQVHNVHYEGYGILESFYRIVQKEGFWSLYNGNGAQMLRIFPYAAVQFTSYESFKRLNRKLFGKQASENILNNLVCGSLAGISAVTTTYPLDVIRSRLAFQYKTEKTYYGIIDSFKKIYAETNSVRSFYRGYGITILGMVPYAGLSFTSYDRIKKFIINKKAKYLTIESDTKVYMPASTLVSSSPSTMATVSSPDILNPSKNAEHKYYELTVPGKLICGGITAILAQTITYPLDVVRRHMQLATMLKDAAFREKMGMLDTLKYVYTNYGLVRGLYRGITLNYIRAVPMVSTSFCFYELSKKFFGLNTSELVKVLMVSLTTSIQNISATRPTSPPTPILLSITAEHAY